MKTLSRVVVSLFVLAAALPAFGQGYQPCEVICGTSAGCGNSCDMCVGSGGWIWDTWSSEWQCYEGGVSSQSCADYTWDCEWQAPLPPPEYDINYPNDGFNWDPGPNDAFAGDCFGNCGAGCSDHFNPCGGPHQYWELTITSPVEYGIIHDDYCSVDGTYMRRWAWYGAQATGQWMYHGWAASGCVQHDYTCPEWAWLGCVLFFGCGNGWVQVWSYNQAEYARQEQIYEHWIYEPCEYSGTVTWFES